MLPGPPPRDFRRALEFVRPGGDDLAGAVRRGSRHRVPVFVTFPVLDGPGWHCPAQTRSDPKLMKPRVLVAGLGAGSLVFFSACVSSGESASGDSLTAHVGTYPPPPSDIQRVRVGVPQFQVAKGVTDEVTELAADQITTLLVNTERFDVIERAQLDQLLKEQNLEGIVKGGELAQQAQVRGVDYLLIGKITNLRVKGEKSGRSFGLGHLPIPGAAGGAIGLFDYNNKSSKITVDCGVDLRLVDPTSGAVAVAQSSDYKKTDSISAMGIDILGADANAEAELTIDADNKGKVLRLALDDCVRKMLPKVDRTLVARAKAAAGNGEKK